MLSVKYYAFVDYLLFPLIFRLRIKEFAPKKLLRVLIGIVNARLYFISINGDCLLEPAEIIQIHLLKMS